MLRTERLWKIAMETMVQEFTDCCITVASTLCRRYFVYILEWVLVAISTSHGQCLRISSTHHFERETFGFLLRKAVSVEPLQFQVRTLWGMRITHQHWQQGHWLVWPEETETSQEGGYGNPIWAKQDRVKFVESESALHWECNGCRRWLCWWGHGQCSN